MGQQPQVVPGSIGGDRQIRRPIQEVTILQTKNPVETAYMKVYRQEKIAKGESDSIAHTFVPFDSIAQTLKQAVIAAEDDGFYIHPGFDITAILAAMDYNRSKNQVKRGASTITQQLAKNLFLSSERTFYRKALELGYTVLLEKYLGKERILELYLNFAEWGPNIFGCEAASRHYFKKSAKKLTMYESSRLAAMLAKPATMNPHGSKSKFLWSRLKVIADNLYGKGLIGDSAYVDISGVPPPRRDTVTSEEPAPQPIQ